MDIDLDKLSEAELTALNRRVVERLRLLRQVRAQASMSRFNIGDRVSFQADTRMIVGTLIRHNKKSVTVQTDDGGQWRVSPGFLRPVMDIDSPEGRQGKLIELPRRR